MARLPRVPFAPLSAGDHVLRGAEAKYLGRVHRLAVGAAFVAFDPEAVLEADGAVVAFSRDTVLFRLDPPRAATRVPPTSVTLLQALGKSDKPDRVIRDATALGASRVVLVETARVVARPVADRGAARGDRYRRLAVEAARQSLRGDVPRIEGPSTFEAALSAAPRMGARLVLDPEGDRPLSVALASGALDQGVSLLIGPEGGLTPSEAARARAVGFESVRLGPFVLRTETAATAALAAVAAWW
jgi:16S rRNA (uracil1498-N3)-methyltransferase